jgi:FkbM family methyltransferase
MTQSPDFAEFDGLLMDQADPRMQPAVELLRRGVYEGREVRLVKLLLRPRHRVLELGTCTGFVAMQAARIVGAASVLCYEANPDNARLAERHFAANGMAISLQEAVLAPRLRLGPGTPGTATFHVSRALVSSTLIGAAAGKHRAVEVPRLCLEDEIARHAANCLIVDIEGGEVELLGESDLTGIEMIIMETHYRKAGVRATNAMIARLIAGGFRLDLRNSASEVIHLHRAGTGPEAEEAPG